ncbi:helix-turn-helix domain-containing protein [Blastococcus saxobsidens]
MPAVVLAGRRPQACWTAVPRLSGRHLMPRTTSERAALAHRHDPLLTVAQAGDYLGTGERFVRRLIAQRRITYVKLGKYVRLQRSTLDDFIESGRVASEG